MLRPQLSQTPYQRLLLSVRYMNIKFTPVKYNATFDARVHRSKSVWTIAQCESQRGQQPSPLGKQAGLCHRISSVTSFSSFIAQHSASNTKSTGLRGSCLQTVGPET